MPPLDRSRPPGRLEVRGLGPIGAVAAAVAIVPLLLIGLVTVGVALLFARRSAARIHVGRPGGGVPGAEPDPHSAAAEQADTAADGTAKREGKSYAEIVEAWPLLFALSLALGALAPGAVSAKLLVPMDDAQTNHLKAYGLVYWALAQGQKSEWLLNYRGGSFLLADEAASQREANIRGVSFQPIAASDEARIRAEIADANMEVVALEKAPKVAVYIPPNTPPWDDAVTLALQYADIAYARVWDEEVLRGDLAKYDWLHLHHEDFTGQHGKFWTTYHTMPWYIEEEAVQKAMAAKLGFAKVTALKGAVALAIRDYVSRGGFMFGMCSATDTYDIALAAAGVDLADAIYDGDPADPDAPRKLDFSRTLAFRDFRIEMDPFLYRFSDIDVTTEANQRGPNTLFTLFDFSAKDDPIPAMLTQDHVNAVPEFLGQSTGFRRARIKRGVTILAEIEGTEEVKYLHGQFGRGTFTFLGGHDPEDYQHMVGDPETKLEDFPHSPGYRLILNNVLFPAAEKKKRKT